MKLFIRRMAALILALAMSVTSLAAFAETPTVPHGPLAVYERGNAIKSDVTVTLDADSVLGLLALSGAPALEGSEKLTVDTVLSAINKLTFSTQGDMKGATFAIGTPDGQILDGQMVTDLEQGSYYITTDLLPGIKLSYPQEAVKAMTDMQQQMANVQGQLQKIAPYTAALNKYLQTDVLANARIEDGPFAVAGVGEFKNRTLFDVDAKMLVGVLDTLKEVFKTDAEMQKMLDDYLATMAAQAEDANTTGINSSKDLINALDSAVESADKQPNAKLGELTMYNAAEGLYLEFEGLDPESGKPMFFVSVQQDGKPEDSQVKVAVVVKVAGDQESAEAAPDAAEAAPAAAEAPAKVDWNGVKAGVLGGTDRAGVVVLVSVGNQADAAKNEMNSALAIELHAMGMQGSIKMNAVNSLEGEYKGKADFQLFVLSDKPMLSVSAVYSEIGDPVALPALAEGLKDVMIQEEMGEQDQQLLAESLLQQGMPAFIERLKAALPEEGPLLAAIIESALKNADGQAN